ncbi:MAG: hypothetical protein VX737_04105, partial [Pseudomonadota bacterium]|nr:hypothetical protein [Pseudomonadota bacterium]
IWLQCLGLCMTYPMATANISGSTITVTAPNTAPAAPAVTTKPFVDLHGFSHVADPGSMNFELTINTAEMLWLNQLKTTANYNPTTERYLLPVGKFQYCLDATDKTKGVYMKVNISDEGTNGFVHSNKTAVIAGYALVYGNGEASGGVRELFFGSDTSLDTGDPINRLNLESSTSLDTSTSALNQMVATSEFSGTALTSITNIDSDSSNFTQLNHYHLPDGEYTLAATTAASRSDLTFVYDKTAFHDDVCGTGNAGAIDVVIFMNIADIISQPAGVYQTSIQLTFDSDGS